MQEAGGAGEGEEPSGSGRKPHHLLRHTLSKDQQAGALAAFGAASPEDAAHTIWRLKCVALLLASLPGLLRTAGEACMCRLFAAAHHEAAGERPSWRSGTRYRLQGALACSGKGTAGRGLAAAPITAMLHGGRVSQPGRIAPLRVRCPGSCLCVPR